ncbi:sugar phosphate isomerase/epimerase [Brevibacterium sp. 91QC2O2]|uniref:sugar phosphate isomerase/epimerase family protein n=1 Tax=Brevibacterium sp. 91QC2O2 TaxID=2968458 RepID=UPI00211B9090|nr:sugar phosphate isomerase/epimerase [Brevibacterium sp. 91QC2O2]MCQ9368721.1 sugar phosphate isomerase/epimerase [Brevibacterium sp. 91QC2O2]
MKNSLGIHAGVWTGDWSPENTKLAVAKTVESGYSIIEVTGSDPTSIDTGLLKAEIEGAGLTAAVSMGLTFDADVNTEDPVILARGRRRLDEALEMASAIGTKYLAGCLYSTLGKYPGPATAKARANSVAAVRDLAQGAAESGITVSLEVVNRYESNLINTAEQALRYIDEVGEDVYVHLDTYHMNIEEGDLARPVALVGERLGYVHVGESHRGYLGSGTIDWARFFRALADSQYGGPITFESFSTAVVDPILSNGLSVWRNLWSDSTDLALHARSFIEGQLTAALQGENQA